MNKNSNRNLLTFVKVVSILIPLAVGALILLPKKVELGPWVYQLPLFNAIVNTSTVFCLLGALVAIKGGNIQWHRNLMLSGLGFGVLFLLAYVVYHSSVGSVKFGDLNGDGLLSMEELANVGSSRTVYFVILVSHISLSMAVVPLVLMSVFYGLSGQVDRHKRLVKWSFPIWLYVSVTGVIVYLMISPYYSFR